MSIMSYSQAEKYSEVLEIMMSPYALMIMDFMYKNEGYHNVQEFVDITEASDSKVKDILYRLEHKGIIDKDYDNNEEKYQIQSGTLSYFIERLISIID